MNMKETVKVRQRNPPFLPGLDYLHTALDTLSTPFPAPERDKPENTEV